MDDLTLVHESELEVNGDRFEVLVYCREDGRHIAKTHFGADDIIIHDGSSLSDVLVKHKQLLPLAVTSRKMLHEYRSVHLTNDPSGESGF